jgi:hypothetical protein
MQKLPRGWEFSRNSIPSYERVWKSDNHAICTHLHHGTISFESALYLLDRTRGDKDADDLVDVIVERGSEIQQEKQINKAINRLEKGQIDEQQATEQLEQQTRVKADSLRKAADEVLGQKAWPS